VFDDAGGYGWGVVASPVVVAVGAGCSKVELVEPLSVWGDVVGDCGYQGAPGEAYPALVVVSVEYPLIEFDALGV
jgi:hypothetical protein